MKPHNWTGPTLCPEVGVDHEERRRFHCHACGTSVIVQAYGHMPQRMEFGVVPMNAADPFLDDFPPLKRKITGWETTNQALKRVGLPVDCDEAIVHMVMET